MTDSEQYIAGHPHPFPNEDQVVKDGILLGFAAAGGVAFKEGVRLLHQKRIWDGLTIGTIGVGLMLPAVTDIFIPKIRRLNHSINEALRESSFDL